MRKTILLIFVAINYISSQNLHVIYLNKTSKFTTFQEDLYITKNNIISLRDSVVINSFDEKNSISSGTNEAMFFNKDKIYKIAYFKSHNDKVIYNNHIGEDNFYIEDFLPPMNWNTTYEETKIIAGYKCNKATIEYRGSKITAFYSKDLKYNSGPYKFGGLNGLILEIIDNDNPEFNSWIATVVDDNYMLNHKLPNIPNNTKTISLKEFLILKNLKLEEDFNRKMSNLPTTVVITNNKLIRNGIEKKYEWE